MAQGKRQFRNTTDGYVGVVVYSPRGEEKSIAVEPKGTVFMSDEDIELTRDAPASEEGNPFAPHPYEIRDEAGEVTESGERPWLVEVQEERSSPTTAKRKPGRQSQDEVGAADTPDGEAPSGSFAEGEEVAA